MARLNESTAPTESIEVLKRRFVRQNREIARVNSIQSLRIRSLESEVSHLLSENVSLREQTISLSQELERYEAAKMLHDGVYDIKARLDNKLAELGSLVTDLGALPRKFGKLCDETGESTDQGHSRLSNLDRRRRATDAEYSAASEDGKLPVILEDKCYPRKTLDSQELLDMIQHEQDAPRSPEIEEVTATGEEREHMHFSPELPNGLTDFQMIDSDAEEIGTLLPPTLETRKKRKPSPVAMSKTERAFSPEAATTHHDLSFSLKSGAKRKFMSEEDELFSSAAAEDDDDDFQYSRASQLHSPENRPASMCHEYSPSKTPVEKKRGSRERSSSKRKVLEPKSTNISATSSYKGRTIRDQKAQDKVQTQETSRKSSATHERTEMRQHKSGMDAKPSEHNPDRPLPEDGGARQPTEGQASKESTDLSAPELAKDEATSGVLNTSRPTRRQRSVVSYAEPNLRDKMRRPTNEFADAVTGVNSRRTSNIQNTRPSTNDGDDDRGNSSNKRSSYDFEGPGGAPEFSSEAPQGVTSKNPLTMVSQRKRKTLPASNDEPSVETTAATHSIQHHGMPHEREIHNDDSATGLENGNSEKHESQPEFDYSAVPAKLPAKSATRQARRHSSNPKPVGRNLPSQSEALFQVNPTDASASTTLGLEEESMLARTDKLVLEADSYPQSDLQRSGTDDRQARRGQRTGARRKSMMI